RHGDGMHQRGRDASTPAVGLVEYPELLQHAGAVVVDLLAGEPMSFVECEHPAERKLDRATGGRKSAPNPQMSPANDHLEHDSTFGRMALADIDLQVRHRSQHLRIEGAHLVAAQVVSVPRFVVVTR